MYNAMKSRLLDLLKSTGRKMSTAEVHAVLVVRYTWARVPTLRTTRRWLHRLAGQGRLRLDARDHIFGWRACG